MYANIVDVFCTGKTRVVKITHSSSEVVLRTMKRLGGNSHTSSGLILKMNRCYKGVSRELRKLAW
jgi:hypothetical protein